VRAAFAAFVVWVALSGLWLLYVGLHTKTEAVAGALAAALATGLGAALARGRLLRFRVDARPLARAARLPWYLLRDFALITLALLRGRPEGEWVTVEYPVGGGDARSVGRRALVGVLGTITPNAYYVDFDRERRLLVMHQLDPKRAKGDPL
jgi:hypothetical protein